MSGADLDSIRGLLDDHPEWNRTRLSRELCARWNWHNAQGRPKDMAARTLLLKLERAGHIRLPPRIRPSSNGLRNRRPPAAPMACEPIRGALRDLLPLSATQGRTRNDRAYRIRAAVKDVYLYPLVAGFRRELCA